MKSYSFSVSNETTGWLHDSVCTMIDFDGEKITKLQNNMAVQGGTIVKYPFNAQLKMCAQNIGANTLKISNNTN